MVFNTASSAGGSPLIQRSGLICATHKGAQIGTYEPACFQFLHGCRHFFFQVEHQLGALLLVLQGGPQRVNCERLQSAQNGMIGAATKTRDSFVTNTECDQGAFVKVKCKLRLGPGSVFSTRPR
jgi:hypothetical protein